MARIRTIKPEFPQSETTGKLSRDARLLFLQLFTIADDDGRARAASRMLASLLYPYDDDAPSLIDGWLTELESNDCIRRYQVEGSTYLEITNWLKHQKIDHPSKSRLPPIPDNFASPREASRTLSPDLNLVPSILDRGPSPEPREPSREQAKKIGLIREGVKFPKHGAMSADKRLVYFKRGTKEFEAYADDFCEARGDPPEATSDGRWFNVLGEGLKNAK